MATYKYHGRKAITLVEKIMLALVDIYSLFFPLEGVSFPSEKTFTQPKFL
jgi:hypothetical protein